VRAPFWFVSFGAFAAYADLGRLPRKAAGPDRSDEVDDQLDVPLEDSALLEEVELISTLIIAASENDGQLDQAQIDQLLGVSDARDGGTPST
jgi:hypothetical protein